MPAPTGDRHGKDFTMQAALHVRHVASHDSVLSVSSVREAAVAEQNAYVDEVESMAQQAAEVLQKTCIELHSSTSDMNALMLAHELNEVGSTLCHVAFNTTAKGWTLPIMEGVFCARSSLSLGLGLQFGFLKA
jgi:hypothetical protein